MEAEAFLADSVVAVEGKLYVQGGGWDQLQAATLPVRQPRIGIAILLHVPYNDTNVPHQFELRLEDADGNTLPLGDAPPGISTTDGKIRAIGGPVVVGRPPFLSPGDQQGVAIAANLDGLVFDKVGAYRFVVAVDGEDIKHLPFRIIINVPAQFSPVIR